MALFLLQFVNLYMAINVGKARKQYGVYNVCPKYRMYAHIRVRAQACTHGHILLVWL